MKKLLFSTILIAVIGLGIFWTIKPNGNPTQIPEIKAKNLSLLKIAPAGKTVSKGVASDVYAFKTKDNGVIQIGTERHSPPKPYLKMDKWDGEVSLKVQMPFETGDNPTVIGNKVRYSTADRNNDLGFKIYDFPKARAEEPRVDIDIYPKPADEQNEDGGVEFDTILYEKPASNKIVFPIETNNLDFFYQPALNEENKDPDLTCTETECKDKDGNIINSRPENVVGSYAVYYANGKSGDFSQMGGKNYKAGKALHIYRPKVTDANNNSIWGELNISTESGTLTVSVDQNWLNNAVYPVTVDPTFGYTTAGSSNTTIMNSMAMGRYTGVAGTLTSITASLRWYLFYGPQPHVKLGLYTQSDSSKVFGGATAIAPGSKNWYTESAGTGQTLSAVDYWLVAWGDNNDITYLYRDSSGGSGGTYAFAYGAWPSTVTVSTNAYKYSIYVTYADAATPTPTPSPTPTPTPAPAVNFQGGINLQGGINISD
jgi:hypothetical protein